MVINKFLQPPQPAINLLITNLCNKNCSYCCLKHWITNDRDHAQHMTLKNLDKLVSWLKRSRFNRVQLLGGEPMLHPQIFDIVKKILENGIKIDCILTNGLANTILYENIMNITRTIWLVNVNDPNTYSKEEWNLLNMNLELLKWKGNDELIGWESFEDDWTLLQLSITFYKPNQDYTYIIELAKKYKCTSIRYSPSHPSSDKSNIYIDFEYLLELKPTLIEFFKDCLRNGIKPCLEGPLPLCIFTSREIGFLLLFTERFDTECMPHLDVMPDLTVEYCSSMHKIIPVYHCKNMSAQEIYLRQSNDINKIKEYSLPQCKDCQSFRNKQCQGYCLRLKADFIKKGKTEIKKTFIIKWINDHVVR